MSLLSHYPTRISTVFNNDKLQAKKLEIHVLKTNATLYVSEIYNCRPWHNLRSHYDLCNPQDKNSSSLLTPKIHYRLHQSRPMTPTLNHMNPINTFPFYLFQVLVRNIKKISSSLNVIQAQKVENIQQQYFNTTNSFIQIYLLIKS